MGDVPNAQAGGEPLKGLGDMTIATQDGRAVIITSEEQKSIARFVNAVGGDASDFVTPEEATLPGDVARIINTVLHAVSEGQTFSISTLPKEVTTTTAASMLDVSRPTVMKYIRSGRLSARKVGTHHRLNSQEVLDLLEELKQEQRNAIFELMDLEEGLS